MDRLLSIPSVRILADSLIWVIVSAISVDRLASASSPATSLEVFPMVLRPSAMACAAARRSPAFNFASAISANARRRSVNLAMLRAVPSAPAMSPVFTCASTMLPSAKLLSSVMFRAMLRASAMDWPAPRRSFAFACTAATWLSATARDLS